MFSPSCSISAVQHCCSIHAFQSKLCNPAAQSQLFDLSCLIQLRLNSCSIPAVQFTEFSCSISAVQSQLFNLKNCNIFSVFLASCNFVSRAKYSVSLQSEKKLFSCDFASLIFASVSLRSEMRGHPTLPKIHYIFTCVDPDL